MASPSDDALQRACDALLSADGLVLATGAGMGVDSGLPDFRGSEGFWRAYPPLRALGLVFEQMANPLWFDRDPHLAWGFYGHRLQLYRVTVPHAGFERAAAMAARMPQGLFAYTSNVDGQHQRAGTSERRVCEAHGSIHQLQCTAPCTDETWTAEDVVVEVDVATCRAVGPLPRCPHCGGLARPNILMFGDGRWVSDRTDWQDAAFAEWLEGIDPARLVVLECGAGMAVATIRHLSERLVRRGATLIRINPRDAAVPAGQVALVARAQHGLTALAERLGI